MTLFSFISTTPELTVRWISLGLTTENKSDNLSEFSISPNIFILPEINVETILKLKQKGFSDKRLSELLDCSEEDLRITRKSLNISPVFKRVDSCAAEFDTQTAYLYSTYQSECEANPTTKKKIIFWWRT